MANEQNLRPSEYKFTQEDAKKGAENSAKARREKRTVRKILAELLDGAAQNNPQFNELATKLGVETTKSVKDIFTMVCLLNSVKEGNLCDLERLGKLLGEDNTQDANNGILDELAEYLKEDE